jgi:hypothetical protein
MLMAEGCRDYRRRCQLQGRLRARDGDLLHQAGCMLYWAEGSKGRHTVTLVNSDVNLLRLFRRFLDECFGVDAPRLALRVNVHMNNGLTITEVEGYWLAALSLPSTCLRAHSISSGQARNRGRKIGKLPYGTATLEVRRSTWLMHHIYGAIQEYGGFDEPRWLD